MPIIYGCINEGTRMVVEHPEGQHTKDAQTLAVVLSTVTPREYRRQTVEDADRNFSYLASGDNTIVSCISTKDVRSRTVSAFLESVEALIRGPGALTDVRKLKQILQQKLDFHNDERNDKIGEVQSAVNAARDSITSAIDATMARGDAVDNLAGRSSELVNQSEQFQTNAREIERAECWKKWKMTFLITLIVAIVLIVLSLIICPKWNC